MNPFGLEIRVVEAGTKVTDDRTGESEVVTDDSAVRADNVLYVTQRIYDRLKAEAPTTFAKLQASPK